MKKLLTLRKTPFHTEQLLHIHCFRSFNPFRDIFHCTHLDEHTPCIYLKRSQPLFLSQPLFSSRKTRKKQTGFPRSSPWDCREGRERVLQHLERKKLADSVSRWLSRRHAGEKRGNAVHVSLCRGRTANKTSRAERCRYRRRGF